MTLQKFLDATADVPEAVLRPAMVAALFLEPARTPEACRRFYERVVRELSLDGAADTSDDPGPGGGAPLRTCDATTVTTVSGR